MDPGDRLTLRIERPVAGGRMLARHEGAIVLVSGAIPGEEVDVEVEKVRRGTVWAAVRAIRETSSDRVTPDYDPSCGGSVYAHVRYERQLALKRDVVRDAFSRLARTTLPVDLPVHGSAADGYRMRARLHWRNGRFGFFREGTHELCDAAVTRQLLPQTIDAVRELQAALSRLEGASVLDADIAENRSATERACHLDMSPDTDPSALGRLPAMPSFIGLSCAPGAHMRPLTIRGTPCVTDEVTIASGGGAASYQIRLTRHARAFFQGNRYLLSDLVTAVVEATPPGAVIDLYAGVGLFAVAIGARGQGEVTAVEGDRVAADDLKRNAAAVNVRARHQSVEAFLGTSRSLKAPAAVLVDPPRTGMTGDALRGIVAWRPQRIIYVSCDVATLARDARLLFDASYKLSSIRAFDLFPNTAHVETLAVFDR